MQGPEQAEWIRRLEVELDNLRAAIALSPRRVASITSSPSSSKSLSCVSGFFAATPPKPEITTFAPCSSCPESPSRMSRARMHSTWAASSRPTRATTRKRPRCSLSASRFGAD